MVRLCFRKYQFFHKVFYGFGSLELKIGSIESEKIIKGNMSTDSLKFFGSLQVHTGSLTFFLKNCKHTTVFTLCID